MRVTLYFPDADGSQIDAELVFAGPNAVRGLMGRAFLRPDEGMLFDMLQDADHRFWMRGMLIPLDMIFLDSNDRIVGIVADVQPGDETRQDVGTPSRRVLEVNAGWVAQHGVAPGQRVMGGLA
jgi:uncharacterized protein